MWQVASGESRFGRRGARCGCRWSGRRATAATRPTAATGLGVREAGDEEPERGDMLRDGLVAAGATIVEPPDLGLDPIVAVHDADFVDFMRRAYPAWVAEGHLDEPGQPHVVGVPVRQPGLRRRATGATADRRRSAPSSGCTRWTR